MFFSIHAKKAKDNNMLTQFFLGSNPLTESVYWVGPLAAFGLLIVIYIIAKEEAQGILLVMKSMALRRLFNSLLVCYALALIGAVMYIPIAFLIIRQIYYLRDEIIGVVNVLAKAYQIAYNPFSNEGNDSAQ